MDKSAAIQGYGVDSLSYLQRARSLLIEERKDCLFYAAFELRCCVEARQREYAEAIEKYKWVKRVQPWEIRKLHLELEKVFRSQKIARVSLQFKVNGLRISHYYTPVPQKLIKNAEILGNYLHVMKEFKADGDRWWGDTKDFLLLIYRQAWMSCQGNLIAPPLLNPKTKTLLFPLRLDGEGSDKLIELVGGEKFDLHVEYFIEPPSHWNPDL